MKVRLKKVPDSYRGSKDCLEFLDPVQEFIIEDNDGKGYVYAIADLSGVPLGMLGRYYGNFGRGKLAAEYFRPEPNIEVIYLDD